MHKSACFPGRLARRLAIGIAILTLLSTHAAAEDWPGFQGADRDGVVQDGKLLTDWPKAGPRIAWTHNVGPGFGGAAIAKGKVYILDRDSTDGDIFRAYDLATGKALWTKAYKSPGRAGYHGSRGTPTITDKFAFTVGSFGDVTCFDLEKQTIAWQKHMDDFDAPRPKWYWSQSPLLLGDLVVIAPMAERAGLVALDQATGKVAWKSESIGNEGYGSPRLMTLASTKQIVTLTSKRVTGVEAKTGKLLWSYEGIPVKRGIPTPTAVGNDRVFITAGYDAGSAMIEIKKNGNAFAVKEISRDKLHGGQIHSALLIKGHLYVNLNTNENLRLRGKNAHGIGCFDLDGKLLWKNNDTPGIDRGAVIGIGDKLITLGGQDGVLRLIQTGAAGYKELHAFKVFDVPGRRNNIWAPMAFANGYLVVRSQNQLKCIDLRPKDLSAKK